MDAEKSAKEGKMGEPRPITRSTEAHAHVHPNGACHMFISRVLLHQTLMFLAVKN